MVNSSVVVTGASSGLGLATARELATAGRSVIMTCRSVERGNAAAASIRAAVPDAELRVLELDVASLASVRATASELREGTYSVVCNAGIQVIDGVRRSPDGYELTFATNHLGHFLLISLLSGHLDRVAVVSSGTHYGARRSMGFPSPQWTNPKELADPERQDPSPRAGRVRYSTSKLANLYFTYELARRGVVANAFDPGLMPDTGLTRDYPPRVQRLYQTLRPLLHLMPGVRTVAQSAGALAWLITTQDGSGGYYVGRQAHRSSQESYDLDRAAELWRVSEDLAG